MKKVLMLLLSALLICMLAQNAFAADYDYRLSFNETNWELIEIYHTIEEGTVKFSKDTMLLGKAPGSYMMLFNKEQLTDAKIRFLFKYENLTADPNDNILDFCFRDSVPDKPCWDYDDECYALRFCKHEKGTKAFFTTNKPGIGNQFTRNDKGGYIIKDFIRSYEMIEPGKFYEFVIGAVNENGNVRLTLTIDGKEMINLLDISDKKITEGGYLCITNMGRADITLKMAGVTPKTTTTTRTQTTTTKKTDKTETKTTTTTDDTADTTVEDTSETNDVTESTILENGGQTTDVSSSTDDTETGPTGPGTLNTTIILLIVVIVVLLLAVAGAFAYIFIFMKRSKTQ